VTSASVHPGDFEPSLIAERTYATRRRYGRIDVAILLSMMLLWLDLLPSKLVIPNLTAVGRPALVIALLLFCWWVMSRLNSQLAIGGPQPMRWLVFAFIVSELVSYAVGYMRGLTTMEANGADRALLGAAEFAGVVLIAADGIPNWSRLRGVLRVFVWCSAYMAIIGLLQFALHIDLTQYMRLPGLELHGEFAGFEERGAGGLFRVASTTTHYIEFSALMAIAMPYAIHFARFAPEPGKRKLFTVAALLITAAVPVALSRTGIVSVGIALLVLLPLWGWRMRYNVMVFGAGLVAALFVVKPGLLGTLRSLFVSAGEDPSITGRTDRYGLVQHYFVQRPWLGRGTGTWLPPQYQYLDNQWFATALSTGLLGVAVQAALHITAIALAGIALHRSSRPEDRHLCAVLISTQLIGIFVEFTFDAFAFTTYLTTLSLMVGVCGTVWRFTHPTRTVRTSTVSWYAG
jgi:polysaccharide biosynthesis protein PslJ